LENNENLTRSILDVIFIIAISRLSTCIRERNHTFDNKMLTIKDIYKIKELVVGNKMQH